MRGKFFTSWLREIVSVNQIKIKFHNQGESTVTATQNTYAMKSVKKKKPIRFEISILAFIFSILLHRTAKSAIKAQKTLLADDKMVECAWSIALCVDANLVLLCGFLPNWCLILLLCIKSFRTLRIHTGLLYSCTNKKRYTRNYNFGAA